jgi:hypothetical protein
MFARNGIIIGERQQSGVIRIMSTSHKASQTKATSTYVYTHQFSDPVLDDKRFTTSTEHTLEYRGRDVLYCYAEASAISFCSAAGANYAGNMIVKGYVVRWKYGTNEQGEALSEIESVTDENEREEISHIIWPGMNSRSRVSFG